MYSKGIAWLLWALAWMIPGIHRFYLGKPLSGFFYFITYNFLGAGLLMDAFNMTDMVDAANAREEEQRLRLVGRMGPALPAPEPLFVAILKAAESHGGTLTATEAVMATKKSFAEVERELTKMMHDNLCTVDNHPETGVVLYRFPELEIRRRLT